MTPPLVLAVDGGNSKTDLALLDAAGRLLAWVRGPGSAVGPQRAAALVGRLADRAVRCAGLTSADLTAAHAACYLAGVDVPWQADALHAALTGRLACASAEVGNDAWALLRAGAEAAAAAVAVVCGAGLKCVSRAGGERHEFPGLGWQSGDLSGGGDHLAREAVRVAARAEDGRGPATTLQRAVCEELGVPSVRAVAERLLEGSLRERALGVLVPVVLEHARAGDAVAGGVVEMLTSEVAALARAGRRLTAAAAESWSLVLGGGLFADPAGRLEAALRACAPALADEFDIRVVTVPPVAGAALLGLDRLRAGVPGDAVRGAFGDAAPVLAGPREAAA